MNFWKPFITFYLTIASVDITYGVPLRLDDTKPTKDESASSEPSSSTPHQPNQEQSYANTVIFGPQKIETKQSEEPKSRMTIRNKKKHERRKQRKADQDSLTRMLFSDSREGSTSSQRDFNWSAVKKNTNMHELLHSGKTGKSPASSPKVAASSHEADLFWGALTSSQMKSGIESKKGGTWEDTGLPDLTQQVATLPRRLAKDEKSGLSNTVLSSRASTSQAESTDDRTTLLSRQNKQEKLKASKENEIKGTSQSSNSLGTALVQDNVKKNGKKGLTEETKTDELNDKALEVNLPDGAGTSEERHNVTKEVLTSKPEITAKIGKTGKSYADVVDNNLNTSTDSQQSLPSVSVSKRWGDVSSSDDDDEWPSREDQQKIILKKTEEKKIMGTSRIKLHASEARDGHQQKRSGSSKKPYDMSNHSGSTLQAVSMENHGIDTSHIPFQPDKATSGFMSALEKIAILGQRKGDIDRSMETLGAQTNVRSQSSLKNTPNISKTSNLILIIRFMTVDALIELEQSGINPIVFAASHIVSLRGSGLMVKFHSDEGVANLYNKIAEIIKDIDKKVDMKIGYFKYNIVCIHDVPEETTNLELLHVFKQQYKEDPFSISFVAYRPDIMKDKLKIALLDVDYSLLLNIKLNSTIWMQNMWRRIEICSLSGLAETEYLMSRNNRALLRFASTVSWAEALIPKILEDITKEEIIWNFMKNYNEAPKSIEFMPYTNISKMKMALLIITEQLLAKILITPTIQIRWSERIIITNIQLLRCKKCQLLGHKTKYCHLGKTYRQLPTPHENCVDCSSFNKNHIELIIIQGFGAKNLNHMTDDEECTAKHFYVWRSLKNQNAHYPLVQNYIKNQVFERDTQYFKPTSQLRMFKENEHKELAPVANRTKPSSSVQRGVRIAAIPSQPPSTKSSKMSISPLIKTSHVNSPPIAQNVDFSTPGHLSDENLEELTTDDEVEGPESSFINLRNYIIDEAVQQSVQQTLTDALPPIYKMIIETVYESIQETITKLATTTSEENGIVSSEELPNTEYPENIVTVVDKDKGKRIMEE